jgi:hypothetical protein
VDPANGAVDVDSFLAVDLVALPWNVDIAAFRALPIVRFVAPRNAVSEADRGRMVILPTVAENVF